jgi:hypothetical protein
MFDNTNKFSSDAHNHRGDIIYSRNYTLEKLAMHILHSSTDGTTHIDLSGQEAKRLWL